MRIVTRKVLTPLSKEEVFQIIRNSTSRYSPAEFADNHFCFAFPVRWHKQMGHIPVKGTLNDQNGCTQVYLEIHGGFSFYIGMLFFCIGLIILVYGLLEKTSSVYSAMICAGFGMINYVLALFDGIVCLDSLEHRLTRKLEK